MLDYSGVGPTATSGGVRTEEVLLLLYTSTKSPETLGDRTRWAQIPPGSLVLAALLVALVVSRVAGGHRVATP